MDPLNEQLVESIDRYIEDLFSTEDAALTQNKEHAAAAGMPAIQVSSNEGKLLYLMAKLTCARRVLEIGTLAGYSTTWLARALPEGGSVLSLERESLHADIARRNLERAGVAAKVRIQVGVARESLGELVRRGEEPFDLIFIDADKAGYVEYLGFALQLSRPGTVILADNVMRHGNVMLPDPPDAADRGARAYNSAIAADSRLESLIVPIVRRRIDGLAISIVR
ncbi:MAG TPA: O-methyltransferase [Bryobacteraceae bacterium]|nr:O-methyltransferase [Bryobacteraceae bacterium]